VLTIRVHRHTDVIVSSSRCRPTSFRQRGVITVSCPRFPLRVELFVTDEIARSNNLPVILDYGQVSTGKRTGIRRPETSFAWTSSGNLMLNLYDEGRLDQDSIDLLLSTLTSDSFSE
jgi:hypothetical protein